MDVNYSHYFKSVKGLSHIDVYRICRLFDVVDPCIQHAIKKLLAAGRRGNKDAAKDVSEAIVSLRRYERMAEEDLEMLLAVTAPKSFAAMKEHLEEKCPQEGLPIVEVKPTLVRDENLRWVEAPAKTKSPLPMIDADAISERWHPEVHAGRHFE